MHSVTKIGACWLIAVCSATATAQTAPAEKHVRSPQSSALEALIKALNTNSRSALYTGPITNCTAGVQCNVTLTPQELFGNDGNVATCASNLGEIDINYAENAPVGTQTVIHWTLAQPAPHTPPTNATYVFDYPGLIILEDKNKVAQLGKVSTTDIYMTVTFKRHKDRVIYYPTVYQMIDGENVALCAAADPKIVNN